MFRGHPKGLFRLFFIEMWERLAFYTMVGSLLLYTIDTAQGGLGMSDVVGNEIYGLYLAFVYFTPYLGGLIADRFIGYRRSVFIGGCFFALGFFLMGYDVSQFYFVSGIVCLCIGNGFFKPSISVMVGNLYEPGDPKRDAGFNIFYMGINVGAFAANYLAAWLLGAEGWLWVFKGAGIGMFIGLAILLWSWKVLARADRQPERSPDDTSFGRILSVIIVPALIAGVVGYWLAKTYFGAWFGADFAALVRPAIVGFLFGMIPILIFFVRLGLNANDEEKPGLLALLPVYLCGATFFMVLHLNGSAMTTWAKSNTDRWVPMHAKFQENAFPEYYSNAGEKEPRPNKRTLLATESSEEANKAGQQRMDEATVNTIAERHKGDIKLHTLRDWSKEEETLSPEDQQLKERETAWTLRGCDVYEEIKVEKVVDSHGVETLTVSAAEGAEKLRRVVFLRTEAETTFPVFIVTQKTFDSIYTGYREKYGKDPEEMPPGQYLQLASPIIFQSLNPLFVVGFTPLIVWFFAFRYRRGRNVTTARKIFWGMVLTTVSLCVMGLAGIVTGDGASKASMIWLVGFYAIITIGELCLSPMALSLVTKLSPKRFVGLTMGGWFLAVAFGNNFSGFFGGLQSKMNPTPYFFLLAAIAGVVALIILALLPRMDAAMKKYGA